MAARSRTSWKSLIFVVLIILGGFYFVLQEDDMLAVRPAEAARPNQTSVSVQRLVVNADVQVGSGSGESCGHTSEAFHCVRFLSNYDGDTIQVQIPGVHPLLGEKISVRVLGVDTPEKTGTKPCEKQRAREAQKLVESLLKRAQRIDLLNIDRDKYFRILARVRFDGQDLSEVLLRNALAISYDGGRKPASMDWCRIQKK